MNFLKRNLTVLVITVSAIAGTSQLNAITQVEMSTFDAGASGNYRANPNAEFEYILDNYAEGKSTDGTWFGTFCIEYNEYFTPGHTYDVALNNGSVNGGQSGAVNGKDIISIGTAWLYEQFALGTLTNFVYGNRTHAQQLQNTIWELEGEYSGPNDFGSFLTLAQNVANFDQNYMGEAVKVMNLTKSANNGVSHHQDQLVYTGTARVPDAGSTFALLGFALTSLLAFRLRRR